MHTRLLAVGDRQPAWVDAAVTEYTARLPREWRFRLHAIAASKRRKLGNTPAAIADECERIVAALRHGERIVMLDEHGEELSTTELAAAIDSWQIDGRDLCFVIGGPDGMDDACLARADFRWSLSRLTLPHGIARIVCAEQLYRAASLGSGHPYHRA